MDVMEVIRERYSCRTYRADPVPSQLLMDLVDAGRLAPSSRGAQPWEFVVITDASTLHEIAKLTDHGKHIAQAAACIAVFGRTDHRAVVEDCAAATQNILLAATGMGLGSCWVAGHGKDHAPVVAALLRAPEHLALISLVAVGLAGGSAPADRARRPLDEVLHWQGF